MQKKLGIKGRAERIRQMQDQNTLKRVLRLRVMERRLGMNRYGKPSRLPK